MATCGTCGRDIDEHQRDIGFALPDEVWPLSDEERSARVMSTPDTCVLDQESFFIRCVAYVPIAETEDHFVWGLWAGVSQAVFQQYRELYDVDARNQAPVAGSIANDIPSYPMLRGHPTKIHFQTATERPRLRLKESLHPLSIDQRNGILADRVHDILTATGSGWSAADTWPFDQARNVVAITSRDVLEDGHPVLVVIHYSEDHSRAFVSGETSEVADGRVVSMASSIACDPSLAEVADLAPGWVAQRSYVGGPWERHHDPEM
jgi:hypothetical protein